MVKALRSEFVPGYEATSVYGLDDRFHETCGLEPANRLWIPRWDYPTRSGIMARWRQALELAMSREDIESLSRVARSRGEPARRVERAQMLLDYRENPS